MRRFLIFLACVMMGGGGGATNITIQFKDSTQIQDAHIYSNGPTINFGRSKYLTVTNRVEVTVGCSYANNWKAAFRVPYFFDSIANHPGMVIDSGKLELWVITSASISGAEQIYLRTSGLDSNMNWVEGNKNGAAATDCEMCWDSSRTAGTGTCATKQAWATAGAAGATDTMGLFTGKPSDSVLCSEGEPAGGEKITLWVDTVVMNQWKDYSYANEGFLVEWTTRSGNIQAYLSFYASECNTETAITDSTPVFTLYGHDGAAPAAATKKVGAAKLGSGKW